MIRYALFKAAGSSGAGAAQEKLDSRLRAIAVLGGHAGTHAYGADDLTVYDHGDAARHDQ